jgi:hypothetical protein
MIVFFSYLHLVVHTLINTSSIQKKYKRFWFFYQSNYPKLIMFMISNEHHWIRYEIYFHNLLV